MEDRLWDYIDGLCSPTEKSAIEELLATNREWQQKHRELLNFQGLLNSSELEAPSLRFTKNVMEEITRSHIAPATSTYINKNIIRSISIFFLSIIAGLFVYILGQVRWSGAGGSTSNALPDLQLNKLDTFNWGKIFNNTYTSLFMLVTAIAGLMLLDTYLQRRKQRATQS